MTDDNDINLQEQEAEQEQPPIPKTRKKLQRVDRIVLTTIVLLSAIIAIVLWQGGSAQLRVTEFSWSGKTIGIGDRWFTMAFNRPVDRATVEKNLTIEPSLPGQISWTGRELAYTLSELPVYGSKYRIHLTGAKTTYSNRAGETFASAFKTRDRVFAYIGMSDEERGQLILVNDTQNSRVKLTPQDLIVTHFKIYPDGDKILFSAIERGSGSQGIDKQQIYTVATGLNFTSAKTVQRFGKIQRLLDAKDYQNRQFDLSDNGQTIVVQRVNRNNPADAGLWAISADSQPRPLGLPGSNFLVAPDGNTVAVAQRGGVAIIPLTPAGGASKFFQGYESTIGYASNGLQQLMVKDNADYTRSLMLVERDGTAKELLKTLAPIVSCQLEPRGQRILYCLKVGLVQQDEQQFQQEAFVAAIDLVTNNEVPIFALPNYLDVTMSMSPDGVALLFDQLVTTVASTNAELRTDSGETILKGTLWLVPTPELTAIQADTQPPKINFRELEDYIGFKPQWLR